MAVHLIQADARALPLEDGSVQTCITSPPYWNLRDYGANGQLGLEETPARYVEKLVAVFREVRRVLRDDGTLWLNLGDCYAGSWGAQSRGDFTPGTLEGASSREVCLSARQIKAHPKGTHTGSLKNTPGLKKKDLVGIPWRVAFALQADGWCLRDCIIWAKPNPMPSSVTDRTTTAHEYVFLLTKRVRYFYDADAIREPITSTGGASFGPQTKKVPAGWKQGPGSHGTIHDEGRSSPEVQSRRLADPEERNNPLGRNKRSVWTIPTHSYHGAHFATFPPRLVEPMIRAATSEKGCCPACGAPWRRVVERVAVPSEQTDRQEHLTRSQVERTGGVRSGGTGSTTFGLAADEMPPRVTTAWVPGCKCHAGEPVPCKVLDNFSGAGTTVMVADRLGRTGIGVELKGDYLAMARQRVEEDRERRKHPKPRPKRRREPKAEPMLFG